VYGGAKVVIVHDYATQRGGAERVVLDLLQAFPGARLVTSCWEFGGTYPQFRDHEIETLWIDKIAPLRRDPRRAFPFLSATFSRHHIADADVVICSSSGWAHRVSTTAPKIVYCHNPARWLYQPHDYFPRMSPSLRRQFVKATEGLRRSDAEAAREATTYLVNSAAVAERVRAAYGIDPLVVPPARGISPEGPQTAIPGLEPGYLLTVSRRRAYKHTDRICEAVASMPGERLVIVGRGERATGWPLGVTSLSNLTDPQMRWLYSNAAGLVAVAHEDFGLTPVEAQAFGVPAVVLRKGGYMDSNIEDLTGVFIDDSSVPQIVAGIRTLRRRKWDSAALRRCGERYAPETFTSRIQAIVAETLRGGASADRLHAGDDESVHPDPASGAMSA
jgi:glycosyltransferase involved in cell wall biosynthesis